MICILRSPTNSYRGLPIDQTQKEAEAEEPPDDIDAVQLQGRQQVGEQWRVDLLTVPPAQSVCPQHGTHWALI